MSFKTSSIALIQTRRQRTSCACSAKPPRCARRRAPPTRRRCVPRCRGPAFAPLLQPPPWTGAHAVLRHALVLAPARVPVLVAEEGSHEPRTTVVLRSRSGSSWKSAASASMPGVARRRWRTVVVATRDCPPHSVVDPPQVWPGHCGYPRRPARAAQRGQACVPCRTRRPLRCHTTAACRWSGV